MTADQKKRSFDSRLWSLIALALFILGWFVPLAGKDGNETIIGYAIDYCRDPVSFRYAVLLLLMDLLLIGLPALVIALVAQFGVLAYRRWRKMRG
ncbi:hypothetical protein GC207_03100 [bacterium]|nr:hypothetical protein [bacterium]